MTVALQARAIQFAFLAAVFVGWFAIGHTGAISPLFLPPMEAVGVAIARLVQTDEFWLAENFE